MTEGNRRYRFGPFELDLQKLLLWRNGNLVPLSPKLAETLTLLVEREGDVVEKQELLARIWPDTAVEENSLSQNISALRRVLGPSPNGSPYIETIAKRGYRFVNGAGTAVPPSDRSLPEVTPPATSAAAPISVSNSSAAAQYTINFRISKRKFWLVFSLLMIIVAVYITALIINIRRRSSAAPTPAGDLPIIGIHPRWYDFEDGVDGWTSASSGMITQVISSDAHSYKGHRSLAITFGGPFTPKTQVYVKNPQIPGGDFVMAHIWCPRNNNLTSIALFIEEGNGSWDNDWEPKSEIDFGSWSGFRVLVPTDAITPLRRVGVEFTSHAAWSGTCYLDSVEWVPSW